MESWFGLPVYIQPQRRFTSEGVELEPDGETRLYNARHGWLTVHYRSELVIAFGFMITDPWFRFEISPICRGVVTGKLGRSTYAEIWDGHLTPTAFIGAYNWGYQEAVNFGRGGNYQTYYFANTMHGWSGRGSVHDSSYGLGTLFWLSRGNESEAPFEEPSLQEYRRMIAPDTVGLNGDDLPLAEALGWTGVVFDMDDMRNIEGNGPKGWLSRSGFARRYERRERWRRIVRPLTRRIK